MAQTLAEILRATKIAEDSRDKELEALRLSKASEAERKEHAVIRDFLEKCRTFFITQITNQEPTKHLFVLMGRTGHKTENYDAYSLFEFTANGTGIVSPKFKYTSLWLDFVGWAKEQGLEPRWQYCWDGGGDNSWYTLTVVPLGTPLPKPKY